MEPKELIKRWVKAFNEGDAEKVAAFYANDAVNHQVANDPVEGKEAIKTMFATEFS
ncbi:MAG: nuclear transport factor 2 family protein, partial [Cyanobacteria bacterium P01_E01_bin.34]